MKQGRDRIKILLVALWVTFTVTLAAWWMIFGLRQLDRLNQLHVEQADQLQKHYQMLLWEGGILIVSLIGGGLALFYYARREQKRHSQVEEFFAQVCFEVDKTLGEPAACRWFLNWFDDTPRAEVRGLLLSEVNRTLAQRRGEAKTDDTAAA